MRPTRRANRLGWTLVLVLYIYGIYVNWGW